MFGPGALCSRQQKVTEAGPNRDINQSDKAGQLPRGIGACPRSPGSSEHDQTPKSGRNSFLPLPTQREGSAAERPGGPSKTIILGWLVCIFFFNHPDPFLLDTQTYPRATVGFKFIYLLYVKSRCPPQSLWWFQPTIPDSWFMVTFSLRHCPSVYSAFSHDHYTFSNMSFIFLNPSYGEVEFFLIKFICSIQIRRCHTPGERSSLPTA
jgi:hypothetical protein